jgi:4-azaleucine resistance transporter AzlC
LDNEAASPARTLVSPAGEFTSGIKAELPILVGVIPFGLIYGVLAIEAGIPPLPAQAMSAILFAGSAQFLTAQLYGLYTPAVVMTLAAAVINLRHVLYSASIAPYTKKLSNGWKWLLAYLLTDEAYAVTILHYQKTQPEMDTVPENDNRHWYFLGAGLALWSTWQLSTAAGIFLGGQVPASWSLDFTLALTFIALVVPNLKDRGGLAAALSAGVLSVLAFTLPFKLGLVIASLVGIAAGLLVEGRK